jgi:hypothetical protein
MDDVIVIKRPDHLLTMQKLKILAHDFQRVLFITSRTAY